MLEIIGFLLLLNALRRPIPPHNTDIRSNIAYLESLMSNTRSWVSRVSVGLIVAGVIMQVMMLYFFGKSKILDIFDIHQKEKGKESMSFSTATVLSNEHGH